VSYVEKTPARDCRGVEFDLDDNKVEELQNTTKGLVRPPLRRAACFTHLRRAFTTDELTVIWARHVVFVERGVWPSRSTIEFLTSNGTIARVPWSTAVHDALAGTIWRPTVWRKDFAPEVAGR
jgi:hypothetical protein